MTSPFEALFRDTPRSSDEPAFIEDRVQAHISAFPSAAVEQSLMRIVGAALPGAPVFHVTDPPIDGRPLSELLSPPALPLESLRGIVRDLAHGGLAAYAAAFHQNVWVGTPDAHQVDVRKAARIELRSLDDPGVVVDCVLTPSRPAPPPNLGDQLRERVAERHGAVSIDPSRDRPPLVLAPGLGGVVVHELVGHALEGDVAELGSRLGRYKDRFASPLVRVLDDPSVSRAPWTIDDEGVPPRAVTLVEGGRVAGRLLDRACAAGSTGHGRRGSYLDPVLPRMGCTYIDRGSSHPLEILAETPRGIFVRRLVAAHADPLAGRATFVVTDSDRIEDGRITRPLRPFVVELDVIDALASIDRVGDDLVFDTCVGSCVRAGQPLAVSVGAPTVRLGLIKVIT